jgi:hypothetical protein
MPDYEFDVFISYETDHLVTRWLVEEFVPFFGTFLRQEIAAQTGRRPNKIFFNYKEQEFPDLPAGYKLVAAGIPPGEDWEEFLNGAIKRSRCMLGIWNPTYFQSDICNREWYSFMHRATATGQRTVFGASWHDGTNFPAEAKNLQMADISKFALNFGAGLREARNFPEFRRAVEILAQNVARAVRQAPAFQDWPIENGPGPQPPATIGLTRL